MANEEMRRYWNEAAGPEWLGLEHDFDVALAPFADELVRRAAPLAGEHALDVGCGFGTTVLAVARAVGPEGRVMGVDISAPMLARARQRAAEAGLTNVVWREADVQDAPLPSAHFDVVVSRFGVMFFDDAVAAFRNVAMATKAGGRLTFACWQPRERNPWFTFPTTAMAPYIEVPAPAPGAPGPFSFGDTTLVRDKLGAAGWGDIAVDGYEPEIVQGGGGGVDEVVRHMVRGQVATALASASETDRAAAIEALRRAVSDHIASSGGTARFATAAWMVSARRAA